MVKIKRKVQKNLPQLIEWAWDNPELSRNKRFVSKRKDFPYINQYVIFNEVGYAEIENRYCYGRNDLFTVEVEEEITEDTVIPILIERRDFGNELTYSRYEYVRIKDIKEESSTLFYVENDDKSLTLIWRDGRLVE